MQLVCIYPSLFVILGLNFGVVAIAFAEEAVGNL
jgi:hypothetical protein